MRRIIAQTRKELIQIFRDRLALVLAVLGRDPARQSRAAVLTFTTTLATPLWAYVWPANQPFLDLLTFHAVLVPLTFLPPLLVGIRWPRATAGPRRAG